MDMLHSMATYLGEEADVALQASGHLLALVPHAVLQLLYVGLGPDLLLLHPPGCCQGLGDSEGGPKGPALSCPNRAGGCACTQGCLG